MSYLSSLEAAKFVVLNITFQFDRPLNSSAVEICEILKQSHDYHHKSFIVKFL